MYLRKKLNLLKIHEDRKSFLNYLLKSGKTDQPQQMKLLPVHQDAQCCLWMGNPEGTAMYLGVLLGSGQLQMIYQLWLYNNNSWPHHLSLGDLQCILFVAASEDHSEASINRECSSPIVSWPNCQLLGGHYTCTGFLWVSGYSSRCPGHYLATEHLQDHHFQEELPFVHKEQTVGNPPFLSDMEGGGFKRCFSVAIAILWNHLTLEIRLTTNATVLAF